MKQNSNSKPLFQATLEDLEALINQVLNEREQQRTEAPATGFKIYTNEMLKELLGVGDKLILKYRNDGLLGYTKVGDKFWYTQEDVQQFLAHSYYEAYAFS